MSSVTEKPWGKEFLQASNESYAVKLIVMNKGCRCSLQYHEKKKETIILLKGKLLIDDGETGYLMDQMDSITLNPGTVHRMNGILDSLYVEVSTPELDDVVRLEDDFGRV